MPKYAKSAPSASADATEYPSPIEPDKIIVPSNQDFTSLKRAKGDNAPAWPPAPAQTKIKPSIQNSGLDPDNLPTADKSAMNFGSGGNTDSKAWKDIWGSGQGIGLIEDAPTVEELVDRLKSEFTEASSEFNTKAKILWR